MDKKSYRETITAILKMDLRQAGNDYQDLIESYEAEEEDIRYQEGFMAGLKLAIEKLDRSAFLTDMEVDQ